MILPCGKARAAPRYWYRKQCATLPEGKIIPVKWVNSQFLWYYSGLCRIIR